MERHLIENFEEILKPEVLHVLFRTYADAPKIDFLN